MSERPQVTYYVDGPVVVVQNPARVPLTLHHLTLTDPGSVFSQDVFRQLVAANPKVEFLEQPKR